MSIKTKLNLIKQKFQQTVGGELELSGTTKVRNDAGGSFEYQTHPNFTLDTQIIDKKYVDDNLSSGITANTTYSLGTPAAVDVGGINTGTELTGKTSNEILEEILVPELCGTLTAPSTSTSLGVSGIYEIGCELSFNVTSNFDRGSIDPQYCSASPFRSGPANSYCFTGPQIDGNYSCVTSSASQSVSNYTVACGSNTWGSCTFYDAGVQPRSSKDNPFGSPLSAGNTAGTTDSITGAYPLFATCNTIDTIDKISPLYDMDTANSIEIPLAEESGGDKQKFEIPTTWLSSRPLTGVQQYNTASAQWEYPGGTASCSLSYWSTNSVNESIQGNSIGYCQYVHQCPDRGDVTIRLIF